MPVITVEWLAGRDAAQRRQLTEAITQAFVTTAKVKPEQVWIVFRDVPRTHWGMAGHLLDEPPAH